MKRDRRQTDSCRINNNAKSAMHTSNNRKKAKHQSLIPSAPFFSDEEEAGDDDEPKLGIGGDYQMRMHTDDGAQLMVRAGELQENQLAQADSEREMQFPKRKYCEDIQNFVQSPLHMPFSYPSQKKVILKKHHVRDSPTKLPKIGEEQRIKGILYSSIN